MKNRVFLSFLILFSLILPVYATEVDISTQINSDLTTLTYIFSFDEEFSNDFSFEKPRNVRVSSIKTLDTNETLGYSFAGDFMIIRPRETSAKTYEIILESNQLSQEFREKGTYSLYVNFNFDVDSISHTLTYDQSLGEIREIFPRNYEIQDENRINWEVTEIAPDILFLINLDDYPGQGSQQDSPTNYVLLLIIAFPIFLFVLLFVFLFYKQTEKISEEDDGKKTNKTENSQEEKKIDKQEKEEVNEEDIEDKFDEFIRMYLTENEAEVVRLIKEEEGIQQYDILNHLPSLTKSNLSKIISKLHSKKVLKRIRVGKVNKIYLGEKLNFTSTDEEKKE